MSKFSAYLAKTWVHWLIAAVMFFAASFFYMGRALTDCSTASTSFNSDTSGGLVWFQWAGGNDLVWGKTDKSNYPAGESIDRTQHITSQAFFLPYKVAASLTTPICGANIMVLFGYMATALLMFGLVRWLIGRSAIAVFAGYAAAFVPFHQFKAQSHIVYASGAVFIAIIWAYLWFIKSPSYKRASVLAGVSAIGFYTDGYYILICSLLIGGLAFFTLIMPLAVSVIRRQKKHKIKHWLECLKRQGAYFAWFAFMLAVLISPIAYTQAKYGSQISDSLAAARSPIRIELKNYGARPVEFFAPAYNSQIMPDSYFAWRIKQQHNSNPTESTLFLGYTVIALGIVAIAGLIKPKIRNLKLKNGYSYSGIIFLTLGTALTLFLFSLPYYYSFSRVLIKLTDSWRVLSRLFLAIDPLIILLSALGLFMLTRKWPKPFYIGFIVLCTVVLFMEYLLIPPRLTGDMVKDTPQIYHQIASDNTIDIIAEYPVASLGGGPSTFTFAQIHGKKMVNANDSATSRDAFHSAVAGLNDKQTLGVLKGIGVDVVTIYNTDRLNMDGLVSYYPEIHTSTAQAYKIGDEVKTRRLGLLPSTGFYDLSVDNAQISHRVLRDSGSMEIKKLGADFKYPATTLVSFDAQSILARPVNLTVKQNGKTIWEGEIVNSRVEFSADPARPIQLKATNAINLTNLEAH